MKTFPYLLAAMFASFILTYAIFAAASDDAGIEHWVAEQTSAFAAVASGH
ncbi:hypothetical protein [Hyphomicrobium sp.]|nr:hypothetical protein [Hyphomicrobium sp.]